MDRKDLETRELEAVHFAKLELLAMRETHSKDEIKEQAMKFIQDLLKMATENSAKYFNYDAKLRRCILTDQAKFAANYRNFLEAMEQCRH